MRRRIEEGFRFTTFIAGYFDYYYIAGGQYAYFSMPEGFDYHSLPRFA